MRNYGIFKLTKKFKEIQKILEIMLRKLMIVKSRNIKTNKKMLKINLFEKLWNI